MVQVMQLSPTISTSILTGLGEKGQVTIVVKNDGSGNAGDSAGIDIEFRKVGSQPTEYTWSAE